FSGPGWTRDNVPSMEEIRRFSQELSRRLGYRVEDESEEGNVVLLSRGSKDRYLPGLSPKETRPT
ncbi:MAG: hypothetical protein M1143_01340, partial [Candidatus Thermoplasmatota archaeon]|nr:hypothetical protein [Candidatus Thermoplasmatota archaeon]